MIPGKWHSYANHSYRIVKRDTENYFCDFGKRNRVCGQWGMSGGQGARVLSHSNLKVTERNCSLRVKSSQSRGKVSFREKSDDIEQLGTQ